ncbi:hypothetical protein A8C35_00485 [Ligilactobacillus salivarius]|uniref:JAB domain-containing protein n=1 Tax=Ligilactobacillus salivarius TaxID=1624 RepID=UPI000BAFDD4A|nr:JAB domain-containing protein [Ligilactobacillus salivarius]PAY35043.1 hypothetical protein A8C35_00485 [Ligilactobacillus salivarius]
MTQEEQTEYRVNHKEDIRVTEIVRLKQIKIARPDWQIYSSTQLGNKIIEEIGENSQETLLLLGLDTKNNVTVLSNLFVGGLSSATIEPRAIFQILILNNCARFIIAHNHPSGDTTPSKNDIAISNRLKKLGELMEMQLIDHIIVSDTLYTSLAEEKYLI